MWVVKVFWLQEGRQLEDLIRFPAMIIRAVFVLFRQCAVEGHQHCHRVIMHIWNCILGSGISKPLMVTKRYFRQCMYFAGFCLGRSHHILLNYFQNRTWESKPERKVCKNFDSRRSLILDVGEWFYSVTMSVSRRSNLGVWHQWEMNACAI